MFVFFSNGDGWKRIFTNRWTLDVLHYMAAQKGEHLACPPFSFTAYQSWSRSILITTTQLFHQGMIADCIHSHLRQKPDFIKY